MWFIAALKYVKLNNIYWKIKTLIPPLLVWVPAATTHGLLVPHMAVGCHWRHIWHSAHEKAAKCTCRLKTRGLQILISTSWWGWWDSEPQKSYIYLHVFSENVWKCIKSNSFCIQWFFSGDLAAAAQHFPALCNVSSEDKSGPNLMISSSTLICLAFTTQRPFSS